MQRAVEAEGGQLQLFWANTLHHLEDLPFRLPQMPQNFGGWLVGGWVNDWRQRDKSVWVGGKGGMGRGGEEGPSTAGARGGAVG